MAELSELSCRPFGVAPESKLSRKPKAQYGFVPKLSHRSGKNKKNGLRFTVYCLRRWDNVF